MNDASITECSVVRGSVRKFGYGHKQATATPSVAGVSEAGDCGGDVVAGRVGVAGGAALRRERQPGFRLATALSGWCVGTGRASLAAGDGDAGSAGGGGTGPRWRGDRDRFGRRLSCSGWRGCPGLDAAAGAGRAGAAMIPVPSGVRVWLAVGRTDMRKGMNGLSLQVQQALGRDPHAGDLYVFRGARGDLIKIIWHDGIGMSLYSKRLESGRFIWPSPADGVIAISAAQLAYMLDGIDWRNPVRTWRPEVAGSGCGRLTHLTVEERSGPVMWDNRSRDDDGR